MNSDPLQNLSQEMAKPDIVKILTGSARNFRGWRESGDHYDRPLMMESWSQASDPALSLHSHELLFRNAESQREKDLKEKIKELEETLRKHAELLSKIHATSGLLEQQQMSVEAHSNVMKQENGVNATNSVYCLNRSTQNSPHIVNTINSTQQISSPPAESVKYRIIAEGDNNEEPIEIQLAEDNYTSNLNSSAESGRLEICLNAEENSEGIKAEYNLAMPQPTTPSEQENLIKKRRLTTEQFVATATNSLGSNVQQQPPSENLCINSSSGVRTPVMQNKMNYNNTPAANEADLSPLIEAGIDLENVMVSIGPHETRIPAKVYHNMNWSSASNATRKLLMTLFDRKVLATHSMTGKPSPAFKDQDKPVKKMLDPLIIADIVYVVTRKCNVPEKVVRNSITSKCADENKTMKLRMTKRNEILEMDKENQYE